MKGREELGVQVEDTNEWVGFMCWMWVGKD